ncbi:MAG: CPBP family intramembrane metalloprotease [Balneola sp.]|nr:MAG: CPBP family intramembrane metalloprotease [Balneola sp.]
MEEEKYSTQKNNDISYERVETPPLLSCVEKNGFSHWALAFAWMLFGLIAFQVVANVLALIFILPHVSDPTNADALMVAIQENLNSTFVANSIGQFLVIGLASYLISKVHAPKGKHHEFLRLKGAPKLGLNTGLSILLLVSSWGVVNFLGWLNMGFIDWLISVFPALELIKELQQQMAELITSFIKTENSLFYGLIYIALVPAIFEEIMFRGYIQRALEKSWGVWAAMIVSSLMFGAYHLQAGAVLPLAFIGFVLAYVTYISDSLIPAMVLHFINNGSQVVYGSLNPEFLEQTASSDIGMPWGIVILSMIICPALFLLMHKLNPKRQL